MVQVVVAEHRRPGAQPVTVLGQQPLRQRARAPVAASAARPGGAVPPTSGTGRAAPVPSSSPKPAGRTAARARARRDLGVHRGDGGRVQLRPDLPPGRAGDVLLQQVLHPVAPPGPAADSTAGTGTPAAAASRIAAAVRPRSTPGAAPGSASLSTSGRGCAATATRSTAESPVVCRTTSSVGSRRRAQHVADDPTGGAASGSTAAGIAAAIPPFCAAGRAGCGYAPRVRPDVEQVRAAARAVLAAVAADPRFQRTAHLQVRLGADVVVDEHLRGPERGDVFSVTKTVLALTLGVAARDGRLPPLDQPVSAVLPALRGTPAQDHTWLHLLTMTRGAETDGAWEVDEVTALPGGQVAHLARAPQRTPPGTRFAYDNGASHLLSAAAEAVLGEPVSAYADRELFAPLGIAPPEWTRDPDGVPFGYGHLRLSADDLGRLGRLMLDGGRVGRPAPAGPGLPGRR